MRECNLSPHGGNIYRASAEYGIPLEQILDFSANINPLGVPAEIKKAIISSIDQLTNYPDPDCSELKIDISKYLGVETENIIVGNGASEIIFLLFDVLKPRKVLMPAPTFSEYSRAAEACGVGVEYFELNEENDFNMDIDAFISAIKEDVDTILLCNPNNPTSTLIESGGINALLRFAKAKNINVIIDEAFIELTVEGNKNSAVRLINEYDNLFLIRAFTKLFAVPGLRLGYGIGASRVINKMYHRKMPWSVNTFACSIGKILNDETEYLKNTSGWLLNEMECFYKELCSIKGLKAFRPKTNFILLKILDDRLTSRVLYNILASKGVLIRDASNFKFLDSRFFRVALKDRKSNLVLVELLKEVMNRS